MNLPRQDCAFSINFMLNSTAKATASMIINGKTTPTSSVILTSHELQKLQIFFYYLILSQYETEKHSKNRHRSALNITI